MEAFKKVCKGFGIVCLAVAIADESIASAIMAAIFVAAAFGAGIKGWKDVMGGKKR